MLKLVIQIGIVYASGVSTAVVAVSRVIKSPRGGTRRTAGGR